MKAAVCYTFGEPLTIDELEIDPPAAGEVQVRIAACAICQSDLHWIRGAWGGATPLVAGHEAAGVVAKLGSGVANLMVGEHVVVYLRRSCGRCHYCTLGRPYNCEGQFALDRESRLRNRNGISIAQGLRTAAFAEYAVVDQSQVVKIPPDLPLDRACLLACGVATGVGTVVNTAKVEAGSAVVVIGAGGVGLNSVQGAVIAGATQIIAIDVLDHKLAAARSFGATHVINSRRQDAREAVMALTGGRGVDYAFVTVGSSAAMAQAAQMTGKGGTTVIVGMPGGEDARLTLDVFRLTEGRAVIGSLMGSTRPAIDIPRLVALYQQRRLKLDELVTQRYPLERINEALESMERGEALRNVIVF